MMMVHVQLGEYLEAIAGGENQPRAYLQPGDLGRTNEPH